MNIQTKAKLAKAVIVLIFVFFLLIILGTCNEEKKPKTKAEIEQMHKDSIQEARDKQINLALMGLEKLVKENMKNPDSYDMIKKDYDHKDTLDTVKMYVKFRGDNSFGGKSVSRVDAVYSIKKDALDIVNQSTE
jgi:hypothetical protein